MKLEVFAHAPRTGWSVRPFPELDSERTLLLVFGGSGLPEEQPAALASLLEAYPNSRFLGCSSAGEIHGTKVLDGTLSVAAIRLEHTQVRTARAAVANKAEGSFQAGATLARELAAPDLRALLVLSDGLNVNGSELIHGLNSVLPEAVIVTGGLAGDGDRFRKTWILHGRQVETKAVAAAGFYGERILVSHGSKGGWDIFGPERIITRSEGNVLYELDRVPALRLYKDYLGERASGLPATGLLFPLEIRASAAAEKRLTRTILAVDEQRQSMTFAGDMPQGWHAQLMKANFERLIGGASDAAALARGRLGGGGPTLCVAISCVGRRLVLGERIEEEVEATLDVLPEGTRQIGFYSYGEISPYSSGSCDLHNQTMTLTLLREA